MSKTFRFAFLALACTAVIPLSCKSNVISSTNLFGPDSGTEPPPPTDDASVANDSAAGDSASPVDSAPVVPTLSAIPAQLRVVRGGSIDVEIALTSALVVPVDVSLTGLPSGVTFSLAQAHADAGADSSPDSDADASPLADAAADAADAATVVTIAAGETSATVTLSASSTAAEGEFQPVVHGSGATEFPFDLVVAGASGTLDETFNQGGTLAIVPPGGDGSGQALSVAVQSDGKIVVGGTHAAGAGWAVIRLNADGTRDIAFDTALAAAALPTTGELVDLVVTPNGHLFVLGSTKPGTWPVPAVLGLNADGTRMAAFGINGLWTQDIAFGYLQGATATAIVADESGGVYVSWLHGGAPYSQILHLNAPAQPFSASVPAMIRGLAASPQGVYCAGEVLNDAGVPYLLYAGHLGPTGNVDPAFPGTFGMDAGLTAPQGELVVGDGLLDDAGGFAIPVGHGGGGGFGVATLGRIGLDGGLLLAGGAVTNQINVQHNDGLRRGTVQSDGKLLVVGSGWTSRSYATYVARFTPDARLDPSFAVAGMYLLNVPNTNGINSLSYQDVAVDALGRIVVVGYEAPLGWIVHRLWP